MLRVVDLFLGDTSFLRMLGGVVSAEQGGPGKGWLPRSPAPL